MRTHARHAPPGMGHPPVTRYVYMYPYTEVTFRSTTTGCIHIYSHTFSCLSIKSFELSCNPSKYYHELFHYVTVTLRNYHFLLQQYLELFLP